MIDGQILTSVYNCIKKVYTKVHSLGDNMSEEIRFYLPGCAITKDIQRSMDRQTEQLYDTYVRFFFLEKCLKSNILFFKQLKIEKKRQLIILTLYF